MNGKERIWLILLALVFGAILGFMLKPVKYIPGKTTTETVTEDIIKPVLPDTAKSKGKVKFKPVTELHDIPLDSLTKPNSSGLIYAMLFNGVSIDLAMIPCDSVKYFILTQPFTAEWHDTLASKDTIDEYLEFPKMERTIVLRHHPDTTKTITKTITIEVEKPPGFFDTPIVKYTIYALEAVGFFYLGTKIK